MAFTIASSFLQLLDSPWLPTTITKTNIFFLIDSKTKIPEDTNNDTGSDDDDDDEPGFLNEP